MQDIKKQIQKKGFLVLKESLSKELVEQLRQKTQKILHDDCFFYALLKNYNDIDHLIPGYEVTYTLYAAVWHKKPLQSLSLRCL